MKKQKGSLNKEELPKDVIQHENGLFYKLIDIPGLDKPLRLFNTNKSERLPEETYTEYKIRQKLNKQQEKSKKKNKTIVWDSTIQGTYIKKIHGELK